MTPPLSICAKPAFTAKVPTEEFDSVFANQDTFPPLLVTIRLKKVCKTGMRPMCSPPHFVYRRKNARLSYKQFWLKPPKIKRRDGCEKDEKSSAAGYEKEGEP
jgi:hypothetical protein